MQVAKLGNKNAMTHGHTRGRKFTKTYTAWGNMHKRCADPTWHRYDRYGGRGIRVCERWRNFDNFLADMGEAPHNTTLERSNNDGNYEPGNCVWTTRKKQARNRRSSKFIEYNGKRQTLAAWAEELGIQQSTLSWRIRQGWTPERALSATDGRTLRRQL